MEIKPGYKQTEIGVIPEDWDVKGIGEIGHVSRGAGSQYIEYQDNQGIRFIRINDFFEYNPVFVKPTEAILRFDIRASDILFAGTGESAGASFMPPKEWLGLPHSYNAPKIRVKGNLLPKYVLHSLQSDYVAVQQNRLFVGAAQHFLDLTAISNLKIAFPTNMIEQQLIACALDDLVSLIVSIEKLIEKKKLVKQGVMQELLTGKRRLPGFSGEWEAKRLGDIADIYSGGTPSTSSSQYWHGDINWFTPTEIGNEKYVHKSDRTISDQGLSKSSAKLVPAGTIVLTTRASIGDVSILNCEGCTNQGCQSLVTHAHFDNEFLYYKLLTLKNMMMQYASGSTFFELSPSKLKEILTSVPEYQEQKKIAEVLSGLDRDLKAMKDLRDKYNLIKQSMMQELLTGRIRLI